MWWILIILLSAVVGFGIAEHLKSRAMLRPITQRPCAGIRWRRRFPDVSADSICNFLTLFADAFAFPAKHKKRLRPTDRVMDIYRCLNPPGWSMADVMELETLALDLEREHGLDLHVVWHDEITLGELFERTAGLTTRCS
jgi:propanediol dehydratase small subunit